MSILSEIFENQSDNRLFEAVYDSTKKQWACAYHLYEDGALVTTVTLFRASLFVACRDIESAVFRVESDYASGQLTLPDMGDFQVQQFPK